MDVSRRGWRIKNRHVLAFLLLASCLVMAGNLGSIKYPCFLVIGFMVLLVRKRISIGVLTIFLPSISYVVCGVLSGLCSSFFTSDTIKLGILLLIPPMLAMGVHIYYSDSDVDLIKFLFWGTVIANIPSLFAITTQDLLESQYAFIYGIFVLYYFVKKKWNYEVFALILFILAHKRIALGALVICILIYLVFSRAELKTRNLIWIGGVLFIVVPYIYVYMIKSSLMMEIFSSLGINTMGRSNAWELFNKFYAVTPLFLGKGMGWILEYLGRLNMEAFGNLHNDFLMAYIECGFIGFGIWLCSHVLMIRIMRQRYALSYRTVLFLILAIGYTFINYTTDNILIYSSYWFPLYLIILEVSRKPILE